MEENRRDALTPDTLRWSSFGKESFTTPGGIPQQSPAPAARAYAYERGPDAGTPVTPRPAASPFSREAAGRSWDLETPQECAAPIVSTPGTAQSAAAVAAQAAAAAQAAVTLPSASAGAPQVYTIQLPPQTRAPAPQQRSLWWLPLLLIAALLLGVLLGVLCYPIFAGAGGSAAAPVTPAQTDETAAARIYRDNVDAVARIIAIPGGASDGSTPPAPSAGSGFVIRADGYLLTSAHVVAGASEIRVELQNGKQYRAALVGIEQSRSDAALLKIEAEGLHPVVIGDADALQVGDRICTIGNPMGELSFSLATGYLSAGLREIAVDGASLTVLQTNAAINKGNSGGPLFDASGRVVGMVTAKYAAAQPDSSVEGLGFALPINAVMELVEDWLSGRE